MSDVAMPEGLSTQEIPVSQMVGKLLDFNIESQANTVEYLDKIYRILDKTQKDDAKDNKDEDKQDHEEKKKQSKFFENLNARFTQMFEKVGGGVSKAYDTIAPAIVGQWNLLLNPLKELTGFDPIEGLKKGIGGLFGKKSSKNPSKEDVAKGGFLGAGFLYLTNFLEKTFGVKTKEDGLGKIGDLFSGKGLKGILKGTLGKGFGIGAIVASIIMMVVDGFKGFKLADVWGASKLSSVVGAVIGGTDKGIKGMFKGMGKWALLGAGIGSVVPAVGTLIGGIIGAVFGGIVGFIGGERLAKAFDAVGNWFTSAMSSALTGLQIAGTWMKDHLLIPVQDFFVYVGGVIKESFIETTTDITTFFNQYVFTPIKNFFVFVGNGIVEGVTTSTEVVGGFFNTYLISPVTSFFTTIADSITAFANDPKGTVQGWIDNLIGSITGFFTKMTGLFDYIGEVGFFKGLGNLTKAQFSKDDSIDQLLERFQSTRVNDAIITKDGQVIHTHQDDNIIATKNDPRSIVKMPDVNNVNNVQVDNNKMVGLLSELVTIMRDKDMGNTTVIPAPSTNDNFEALRMMGVN